MSPEEKIRKTIETGNISHAYIFEGSRISGKEAAAVSFLMAINGGKNLEADPDHYEVRAEAGQGRTVKSVKDADLEKLQADLKMKPQGERNTALIYDADTMTPRAQNRFLKTLEEPTPGTVIVLLSENTENLLETIRSRCIIYRFNSECESQAEIDEDTKELISSMLSGKSFHEVKGRMSKVVKTREDAYLLLDLLESRLRDIMTGKDSLRTSMGKDEAIRNIEITEDIRRALHGNAVVGYAMRRLILEIQENQ